MDSHGGNRALHAARLRRISASGNEVDNSVELGHGTSARILACLAKHVAYRPAAILLNVVLVHHGHLQVRATELSDVFPANTRPHMVVQPQSHLQRLAGPAFQSAK